MNGRGRHMRLLPDYESRTLLHGFLGSRGPYFLDWEDIGASEGKERK